MKRLRSLITGLAIVALGVVYSGGAALADASMPSNVIVTPTGPDTITVTWNPSVSGSSTISGYTVFRNGTQVATSTGTTFLDTGLSPSTNYSYSIGAFDANGSSSTLSTIISGMTLASSSTTASTTASSTASSTLPSMPTGLAGTGTSGSTINLTWTGSTDANFTPSQLTYSIYRNGALVGTTTAGTLSFNDTGLSPGTSYTYTIAANNPNGGISAQTVGVSVMTQSGTTTTTSTPPTAPMNLVASGTSSSSISLSWNMNASSSSSTGITFAIFRNGTKVASSTAASFVDTGLVAGTTYAYNVAAINGSGMSSDWSATVFGTTLSGSGTTPGSTSTPSSTPLIFNGSLGWMVIPASLYNNIWNASSSSSTPGSSNSPFTYINGYPTINGNYYDCFGNIDNDMGHHTTNANDTDPGHRIGQNCPGGMPMVPNMNGSNGNGMGMGNGNMNQWVNWFFMPGTNFQWAVIPLNSENLQTLTNGIQNKQGILPTTQ